MKKNPFVLCFFLLFFFKTADSIPSWKTYYESHQKQQTPDYNNTIEFSKKLAANSSLLHFTSFGQSHENRDLPLLILDKNGNNTVETVKSSGNKILMIQAAIHPGEPAGKDAGLILFRDMIIHGKHTEYLENITILFIPIVNVDGHERFGPYNRINQNGPKEMGWRTNARNINLNRDYLKADSKEMRAFLKLWHHWEPDFFIDTHSTNGGDYQYTLTWAMEIYGGTDNRLVNWKKEKYLPAVEEKMEADGYPIFPYVTYRSWHDPRSGLRSWVGNPMYSNSYVSHLNRPALLIETHMLKPYEERVHATHQMILHTLDVLHHDTALKSVIEKVDKYTASPEFRETPFPLLFEPTTDSVMVDFLGVEYIRKESTLSGGDWFIYDSTQPTTYQVPYFNSHRVSEDVNLPAAYIIPPAYKNIADRLALHNIEMYQLREPQKIEVETYRFSEVELSGRSTEGRQTASFKVNALTEMRNFPAQSIILPIEQRQARIIAHALEPLAPGSFAHWGFFNAVFERVEYFESYVMEEMAREMLSNDPSLKNRLEKVLEKNPAMAENPYAILSWFYEQTPYYDQQHNLYPVGRVMDTLYLEELERF